MPFFESVPVLQGRGINGDSAAPGILNTEIITAFSPKSADYVAHPEPLYSGHKRTLPHIYTHIYIFNHLCQVLENYSYFV